MSVSQSSQAQPSPSPEKIWELILGQLQTQMTQATFDSWLKGTHVVSLDRQLLVIGTRNAFAKEWLENRLFTPIQRTVTSVLGYAVEIRFVLEVEDDTGSHQNELAPATVATDKVSRPDLEAEDSDIPAGEEASPGRLVAKADFFAAWFGKQKNAGGYSLLPHYYSYFWAPYLGNAFNLWKRLDAGMDIPVKRRNIKAVPNRWSPPRRYTYRELARMMNKKHPRVISGDWLECWQSMKHRLETGTALAECCHQHCPIKKKPDLKGVERCMYWGIGYLERLYQEGLVAIEEKPAHRPRSHLLKIQVWRLLPILTPGQVEQLNPSLQKEHKDWIKNYGPLFNLSGADEWETITEQILVPLLEGYDEGKLLHGDYNPRLAKT